ncbi:putative oxidoreductase C-terminal domain-containing protein [Aureibaculum sp. 2210JD6-5]|uniref:putative oxidoreductase C-terminal domain-containing protein n=1 Tax=Aureibaculum sp. 2210JD6-5 TaxID=3103957 RepID=UPI002AAD27C0|nr:putative oxidoreductase C-terminal domain-containing protein [Aureibaculum sp. 2210JD6-5]MDY7395485.1 putative oxidoreductase C-terminal domain-containing protein [Aureibaculum sp. 2210JD6-5]
MKNLKYVLILSLLIIACKKDIKQSDNDQKEDSLKTDKVTLITLDPGHFHAALVQKSMYDQVNDTVYVYAPTGDDLENHLKLIDGFNNRETNPTDWKEQVYRGDDYLQKMIAENKGNVMVVSGKNNKKIDYIKAAIDAGIHVYADKPLVINPEGFLALEEAFKMATSKNLLIYDVMTERFESTTILQRELSMIPEVFGTLIDGTPDNPAITKESVHHFSKTVAGKPLTRPTWFFDTQQRGEGLTDVSTHLVDLIQWEAFPNQTLQKSDIEIIDAKHWATTLDNAMFEKVTGASSFPDFLEKNIVDDKLKIYCNGSILYKIKGKVAKTSVIWNFEAPEGTGDTHYSIMRGAKCDLIIKQGAEENFKPQLYVKLKNKVDKTKFEEELNIALTVTLADKFEGLELKLVDDELTYAVNIPEKYKIGHEAHFEQVTENFLKYLKSGTMPDWEVPNMVVKYYTTTEALKKVNKK